MTRYKICLLPGDGIGPEVIDCAVQVLRALPLEWDFMEGGIGYAEYQRGGSPLPEETLQKICSADATLFGAVTTPPNIPNYFSPVVRMRQSLDLYANLRPCRSIPHQSSRPGIDFMIVRENTEGLYSGSSGLKTMAIARLLNASSHGAAPSGSSAKHLTLRVKPDAKPSMWFTKPMCFVKPADCFVLWQLKSQKIIPKSLCWKCLWTLVQWNSCARRSNLK